MPLGLTHQINRVTWYRRQANRVIYPVYPVGVRPLDGRLVVQDTPRGFVRGADMLSGAAVTT